MAKEKTPRCFCCGKPINSKAMSKGNCLYIGQGLYRHKFHRDETLEKGWVKVRALRANS